METPLIERRRLFGNPSRTGAQVSPDGRWLSWLAPRDGVMNVWTAPTSDPDKASAITNERVRPIRAYFWSPDSRQVLFVNDQGGDENFKLYGVAPGGGETRTLTPFEKTQTQIVKVSRTVPDRILLGLNNRDPHWHDVHSLDLATGALSLVARNDGFADFLVDQSLTLRGGVRPRPDGGLDYHRVENGVPSTTPYLTVSFDDAPTTYPLGYTTDGRTLYWIDSRDRNTASLVGEDVASGARSVLAEDARVDIENVLFNPMTRVAEAYAANYLRTAWIAVDPAIKGDLEFLAGAVEGDISIQSRTDADDLWVLGALTQFEIAGP